MQIDFLYIIYTSKKTLSVLKLLLKILGSIILIKYLDLGIIFINSIKVYSYPAKGRNNKLNRLLKF